MSGNGIAGGGWSERKMLENNYEDIINLPHHVSKSHPHMPYADRAAQFSPFAALTGYESAIEETGRVTAAQIELDENEREQLDEKLKVLRDKIETHPIISVTYFVPDARKAGGSYRTESGPIQKIDSYKEQMILEKGVHIPMHRIVDMDGKIFWKTDL